MEEKLITILETLGAEGINVIYFYLILEYGTAWIVIGLFVLLLRFLWKNRKEI